MVLKPIKELSLYEKTPVLRSIGHVRRSLGDISRLLGAAKNGSWSTESGPPIPFMFLAKAGYSGHLHRCP